MAFALDIVLNFISATKSAVQKQHESWHKHRPEFRDTSGIFCTTQREIVCGQEKSNTSKFACQTGTLMKSNYLFRSTTL